MALIKHCIIDTTTNLVVNVIEYEEIQTGIPPGLNENLLCVANDVYGIGDSYVNGAFIAAPQPEIKDPRSNI